MRCRDVRGLGGRIAGALGLLLCGSLALAVPASAESKAAAAFTARGSVEQVQVTGAVPGERLTLADRQGEKVETRQAGQLGGIVFRNVEPGGGYTVRQGKGSGAPQTPRFRVLSDRSAPPDPSIYDQALPAGGYGYLTTRDGTKLAINVQPARARRRGPLPDPGRVLGLRLRRPRRRRELDRAARRRVLGFAVVDVNMRGTGCSGGAFDYFEPLQSLDGYDVIETVARQPWVLNGKVGMVGVSYGGISQLFVAATRPPSLAAITPLSVIDNTQTTLYPGGILNTGFALEWAKDRVHDAQPASPTTGQELGVGADPGRRRDLRRKPGAAPRGGRPARQDPPQRLLPPQGRRPALADHLRPQDQGAGVHRLPVDRRADRRPLPDARRRASPAPTASGSRSPTASTPTRSTRRPSTAGSTSSSSTSPQRRPALTPARRPLAPIIYPAVLGHSRA